MRIPSHDAAKDCAAQILVGQGEPVDMIPKHVRQCSTQHVVRLCADSFAAIGVKMSQAQLSVVRRVGDILRRI